jgi:hypothetical protein
MKAHTASLINAISLIGLGIWSYLGSETPSPTALIPVAIGAILLLTYKGLKNENKNIAHFAAMLTVILLFALFKPLTGAIAREDSLGILRVITMQATTVLAIVFFVKSFIDARKRRAKQQ